MIRYVILRSIHIGPALKMSLGPGDKQHFTRETFIHQISRSQLLVRPDTPPIPTHLRGKQKGIIQILKERNLWPENGRRSDGVRFLHQCPKDSTRTGCNLDFEDLAAVHAVCQQLNRTSGSKRADRRKNWSIVGSWLSSQVPLLLSGTGVTAGGIPGKIVSTN